MSAAADLKTPAWQTNPFDNEQMQRAWDAVTKQDRRVTDHISGTLIDQSIMLIECVRTFYAVAAIVPFAIFPELLVAAIAQFPDGGYADRVATQAFADDVRVLWQRCRDEAMGGSAKAKEHRTLAATLFDPWADLDPPQWPSGVLPPQHEAMIAALAKRDGCDLGALSMAYITAISGAAHKDMRFAPFQHGEWQVPPIVYVMAVADPGFRKSVLISTAFAALWRHDNDEWDTYQSEKRAAGNESEKPDEPAPLIVTDISVEKLEAILARSPRGVLYLRDEIAPLFDFRRYSKGTGAAERAFFLTAYEAGESRVHRLGRDTDHGRPTGLTVFGGIQIDRIADFTDLGNDGLLQRFIPIVIAHHNLSEPDVAVQGKHLLDHAIGTIVRDRGNDLYSTTPDGSALIRRTEVLGHQMAATTDYGKIVQGFCYKLHGLHARLAFLLHLLDAPNESVIAAATIERASRLTMYCLGQFQAFCSRTPDKMLEATKAVAGYILARPAPRGEDQERIVASSFTSGVRLCRGMPLRRLQEVLDPLVAGGWVTPETPYGDNSAWVVTPGVRDALRQRAEAERERRQAAREAIRAAAAVRTSS